MISNVSFMAKKEAPFYPTEKIRNIIILDLFKKQIITKNKIKNY